MCKYYKVRSLKNKKKISNTESAFDSKLLLKVIGNNCTNGNGIVAAVDPLGNDIKKSVMI